MRGADYLRALQGRAIERGRSQAAHWGWDKKVYTQWSTHSNRLVPVYTYGTKGAGEGVDLGSYSGVNSPYRDKEKIKRLYGRIPRGTFNPAAEYLDQTNVFDVQRAGLASGKKHIILVVFDGMDWQTTWAAAIYNAKKVAYSSGRGTGTHFQDYQAGGASQFGFMVTSPLSDGAEVDVDRQRVIAPGELRGGYDAGRGGPNPWTAGGDDKYLVSRPTGDPRRHPYPDSASTAVSMTAGVKTYNNAINVLASGRHIRTIAHLAQRRGYAVGAVSNVPLSHATPAAAYAHNVHRNDYQDIARDMLGLPSISHPVNPLPGMDVVIGGGHGVRREKDQGQGRNFQPGGVYLADDDLSKVDVARGGKYGKYVVAQRTSGVDGGKRLRQAAAEAAKKGRRLLGYYGLGQHRGHLPFQTADGDYQPGPGSQKRAEVSSKADLLENPTLADMTRAALTVLGRDPHGFWLMVEAGDVDWANHDNNLDNSIGAVNSGDEAVKAVTDWVEKHSNWKESLLIVTADHGHYLSLDRPELLIPRE